MGWGGWDKAAMLPASCNKRWAGAGRWPSAWLESERGQSGADSRGERACCCCALDACSQAPAQPGAGCFAPPTHSALLKPGPPLPALQVVSYNWDLNLVGNYWGEHQQQHQGLAGSAGTLLMSKHGWGAAVCKASWGGGAAAANRCSRPPARCPALLGWLGALEHPPLSASCANNLPSAAPCQDGTTPPPAPTTIPVRRPLLVRHMRGLLALSHAGPLPGFVCSGVGRVHPCAKRQGSQPAWSAFCATRARLRLPTASPPSRHEAHQAQLV